MKIIPLYSINSWPNVEQEQIAILAQHPEPFNSILIYAFDDCNMKCKFCITNAEHSKALVQYNHKTLFDYIEKVRKCLPLMRKDGKFGLTLIGGEIFLPKIDISIYDDFFTQLRPLVGPNCQFQIISNFLFDKPNEVYALIKKHNIKLDLSFDLVGRYTKPYMVGKVLNNVYDLLSQDKTYNVNVIMTNHNKNINSIMNHGENFDTFIELYSNPRVKIQLGEYIDMSLWLGSKDEWAPSVEQCVVFFKHLINNYPNIKDVQQLKTNLKLGKLTEYRCGEIYISSNKIGYCTDDYIARRSKYTFSHACWMCKYFKCCSLVCYKGCVDFNICWKKEIHDYLISKGCEFNEQ